MKEPDPILLLDNDRNVIAQYDPTLRGGKNAEGKYVRAIDVEGSYQHSIQELDLARLEGRITPAQFTEYVGWMNEARADYRASLSDYHLDEQRLDIALGEIFRKSFDGEEIVGAMNDATQIANAFRNREIYLPTRAQIRTDLKNTERVLELLGKQSKTLEGIASNLNRKAA